MRQIVIIALRLWIGLQARLAAHAQSTTPPFSIRQQGSHQWLFNPAGERFFSMGVCCVNRGISRNDYDPENPAYGSWRYYQDDACWAQTAARRLEQWGYTTIGAWSDTDAFKDLKNSRLFLTPVLHIGSTAGAPWWDMWDPKVMQRMEDTARDQILAVRDDPRLLGYYSDNEMGWWNAALFKMTLEHPPSSGQRQRLLTLLRESYGGDWSRLHVDFEAENAGNWEQLDQRGMLYLRPGGKGIHLMRRFLGMIAERYYSLVHDIIRKYDSRALILGDRYQSFYYPEVARAASAHVDAISSNLNAHWNDGTFLRCHLKTLHDLTGKPVLVSEIYMSANDNRSGNRNSQGVFPVVQTQNERAAALRRSVLELIRLPSVVGIDWFQYADEPTHGRGDGENFNFGLVDIHDRPYDEVTAVLRALKTKIAARENKPHSDASHGVPPAPRDPFANFAPTLALKKWDRERGFIPPASEAATADLYICWSERAIFLGLYALDIVEDAYYRDRNVPKNDRSQWLVTPAGRALAIRARIGAGREPLVNEPLARVENVSGVSLNVRNIACMELPASLFGRKRFRAGDSIELATTLFTHCEAQRIEWKGTFKLVR